MQNIDWSKLQTAKERQNQAQAIKEEDVKTAAREYLAETDWYVARFAETGTEIPDDVRRQRAEARAEL